MDKKKTFLLLGDDIRTFSGVANQSRNILLGLKQNGFNCVQIGAGKHNKGKVQSEVWNEIKIYPSENYGNKRLVENVMALEHPDYVMIFTDPRYWIWLFEFEDTIRSKAPLLYYHLWDNEPYPKYNKLYYESCDWIGCINKQSIDFIEQVTDKHFDRDKWNLTYLPHGIEHLLYAPIDPSNDELLKFQKNFFRGMEDKFDFKVLFNSRNAWRKNPSNLIWAFNEFAQTLTEEERKRTILILHTDIVDNVGTNLGAVKNDLYPDINVMFSTKKINPEHMPLLYNSVDVTVCPSSAEGFGLSFAESVMCGTPAIATITGGLQDQMNVKYEKDFGKEYMHDSIWKGLKSGENQIVSYGEWCIPLFPEARVMKGSPQTPYIYEDYYSNVDLANAIQKMYYMKNRKENGIRGRTWMIKAGFTIDKLIEKLIDELKIIDKNWRPRNEKRLAKI